MLFDELLSSDLFSGLFRLVLEVGTLSRLGQLLVCWCGHVAPDLDQHGFHGEFALPLAYAGKFGKVDLLIVNWLSSTGMLRIRSSIQLTLPVRGSTHGKLTLLMKVTSGGTSG